MKRVELTRGQFALMDNGDFSKIKDNKWLASWAVNTNSFYAERRASKKEISEGCPSHLSMHRVVMNAKKGDIIDHINHNTLDNRKCNLRFVTCSQNNMNKKAYSNNNSGIPGVNWRPVSKKWRAYIQSEGKQVHLGSFTSKDDAIKARKAGEIKYFGEYRLK